MRSLFFVFAGSVLLLTGCTDHPENPPSAYGVILDALPSIPKAEVPFSFPMEGDNDHQNCKFDDLDFM